MTITGAPGGTAGSIGSVQWLDVQAGTGANWLPNDLIVVIVGCDNSGAGGASPVSGVTDTKGHAYTVRHNRKKSNGVTPNDSVALAIFTAVVGAAGMSSSDVITAHFGGITTPSSTVLVWQFRTNLGLWQFNDTTDINDEGYSTTMGWSGFQVVAGVCVVAAAVGEYTGTPGSDTDTQHGSWSPRHTRTAGTGSSITSIAIASQWKVPSATGTQQYTSTTGSVSCDWVSVGMTFRDDVAPTVSASGSANLGALNATVYNVQIIVGEVVAEGSADLRQLIAQADTVVTLREGAGCPFTRADQPMGDWAPDWLMVVDSYYADAWHDLTEASYHVELGDGMAEGEPRVTVAEVVVSLLDPVGAWADIDSTSEHPQPGAPLRVSLVDPAGVIHPVITAELERMEDIHDGDHPRVVTLRGFGRVINLVVDVPGVSLPAGQLASARFLELATMAGWYQPGLEFPAGDTPLIGTVRANLIIRDEMDRTAQSAGWFMDADRFGRLRVRPWPHELAGPVLEVGDCHELEGGGPLVSHSITFANDESHLLNYVVTSNDEIMHVTVEDPDSVKAYGRRGRAFGFPLMGLAWSDDVAARQWASRVAQRFAWITRQVESFEVDTHVDQRWLEALADLDTGRAVRVTRTGPTPLSLEGVVTGWRYTLDPGRWGGTVFVSTATTSKPPVPPGLRDGSVYGWTTSNAGTVITISEHTDPWADNAWPDVLAEMDIALNGVPVGRYKLNSSTAAPVGYWGRSAVWLQLSKTNLGGVDNSAIMNPLMGQATTMTWSNLTPPAVVTKD